MKLLLDTNVVVWMTGWRQRLRPEVLTALADRGNELVVSTASLLEIASKTARGRLAFDDQMLGDLERQVRFLPVSASHAWRVARLPVLHTDPFDRLLVAQALEERMVLVTGDHALSAYDVPLLLT
ncbi:type II toxin-antitoxin system VapC family toxin [Brevundimonas sp.]|uniref:type II toxin-antitoxin system VapC family toxin n=1 Tax=Brevundimonas sp. TaxID=1871086 RepID=UPI0037BF894A